MVVFCLMRTGRAIDCNLFRLKKAAVRMRITSELLENGRFRAGSISSPLYELVTELEAVRREGLLASSGPCEATLALAAT